MSAEGNNTLIQFKDRNTLTGSFDLRLISLYTHTICCAYWLIH